MRDVKRLFVAVATVAMLAATGPVLAGSSKGACQAGGVNTAVLEKAQVKYWQWFIGGGSQEAGRLFFVPLPSGDQISDNPAIFQGEMSFSVRTGRTLVLPMITVYGESYTDPPGYPDDDPDDYVGVGRIEFLASTLLLKVDGRVVADSMRTQLDCLSFGPVYFPEPILYSEPTDYGSNAALWVAGLGILLQPMSPGEHMIEMQVVTPSNGIFGASAYGYYNTWHVTVQTP
jgi:hypothetical protein